MTAPAHHPLKTCQRCHKPAEQVGGIEMRGKWFCAACWIKWMNSK